MSAGICREKEAILTADSEVRALGFFSGQGKTLLRPCLMVLRFLIWKEKLLLMPESSRSGEQGSGLLCCVWEASPGA